MSSDLEDFGPRACPTCGATGTAPCIRGRRPSAVWMRGDLMPHRHDSRVTANSLDTKETP